MTGLQDPQGNRDSAVLLPAAIPAELTFEDVTLRYHKTIPGDPTRGLVPSHRFKIIFAHKDVGHISFKVGDTSHIRFVAGHIGYEVRKPFRGLGLAYKACRALSPLVRQLYESVIITVNPDNRPSIRVIEKLGACFLEQVTVPKQDPAYEHGARRKLRYRWTLPPLT